jgi:hypothetical protein
MPGRPTIFEHRDPRDEIRRPMTALAAHPQSVLNALTLVAGEQQTMNYYMNIGNRFQEPLARGTYAEIAMIEEQHVSHYESILDPGLSWLENLVLHEYHECWMYWSFVQDEIDPRVRQTYELHLGMEIEHLRIACELLKNIERREPEAILPAAGFERAVSFRENKQYVRQVLADQINLTAKNSDFVPISTVPVDDRYHAYQIKVNAGWSPTEDVIKQTITTGDGEYRLMTEGPHPVAALQEAARASEGTDYAKYMSGAA